MMTPPEVNLGVLNIVCARMHQEPFQLQHAGDTGDVLWLIEDLEKVKKKPYKGTGGRHQGTEGTICENGGRDWSTEAENNWVVSHNIWSEEATSVFCSTDAQPGGLTCSTNTVLATDI